MSVDEMKAMVLKAPGVDGLTLERRPIPRPGPEEVLVTVRACGVGKTVLRKVRGLPQEHLPRIPGHEIVGDVAAVGEGVTQLAVGDPVLVYTYVTCGRCEPCWRDRAPLCVQSPNYAAWAAGEHWDGGFRIGEDRDGGFAEHVTVPVRNAISLPPGVSYPAATTAVDAIATSLHVSKLSGLAPGERIVVVGAAGGIGVHLLQVATWFGAHAVAVDLPAKLEGLNRYGAVEVIDGSNPDWHKKLSSPADVVADFVGSPATLSASLSALGSRGRLVVLTPDIGVDFPVPTRWMVGGERMILGSKAHSHADVHEGARLLANGTITPVISRTASLEEAPHILNEIQQDQFFARGVIDFDR